MGEREGIERGRRGVRRTGMGGRSGRKGWEKGMERRGERRAKYRYG